MSRPVSRDYLPRRVLVKLTPLRYQIAELHDMTVVDDLKQYPDGFAPVYELVPGTLRKEEAVAFVEGTPMLRCTVRE